MENMQNGMNSNMGSTMPMSHEAKSDAKNVCNCPHHKAVPMLVIFFGALFLLEAIGIFTSGFVSIIWPVLVIIAGGVKLTASKCKCC